MFDCIFERNCISVPIPQQCLPFCLERILRKATRDQKRDILRLSPETIDAVFTAYNRYSINNFEDLKKHLKENHVQELLFVFQNITQRQLNQFIDPFKLGNDREENELLT